jgi:hypothetical protein
MRFFVLPTALQYLQLSGETESGSAGEQLDMGIAKPKGASMTPGCLGGSRRQGNLHPSRH